MPTPNPKVSVINFGDGVDRDIKDAESIISISVNGTQQTKTNRAVDIDIQSIVSAQVAAALQGVSFSVDFSTGELIYTIGS